MNWSFSKILFVLIVLTVLFFWRVVFLSEVFYVIDHSVQNFPFRAFFAEGLKQGKLRLWCPYIYSGFPLFAENQSGPLYPLNIFFFLLLPAWAAYSYCTIIHYPLAGMFMYLFLRAFGLQKPGALFGALTFMFSGFLVTHLLHTSMMNAAIWLPRSLPRKRTAYGAVCIFAALLQGRAFSNLFDLPCCSDNFRL